MRDSEWRLSYLGTDFTFGPGDLPVFNRITPDIGDYEIRISDGDIPRGDGIAFGTDFFGARTITFELGIRASNETAARAAAATLASAWRADRVRLTPGAVTELRSQYRGSERVVFGRPRRIALTLADVRTNHYVTALTTFACADALFYSGVENSQQVALVPALGGGLTAPLVSPLTTSRSSDRSTGITIGGELPTWPVLEITGPITNPAVEFIGGPRFAFNVSLAFDQTLTVDTRPWARTVLINGVNAAGKVARSSVRLSGAQIAPGPYEVSFSGVSETGTAVLRVRWRDAYPTP